jgi:hypothetical protein
MATRTDIFVRWELDPRIIEIMAPSVELTIQDLVDTVRVLEEQFIGMSHPHLLNAGGKEALGGGVFVGITTELQNAQILFEADPMSIETGTITTASGTPIRRAVLLTDASATFITNGVQRGYFVINHTDRSVAEVLNVNSETELLVGLPVLGTLNDYQIGDAYTVASTIATVVRGGNLVAVDDMAATINAAVAAALNFMTVEKASGSTIVIPDPFPVDVHSIRGSELAAILLGLAAQTMARGTVTVVNSPTSIEVVWDDLFDPEAGDGLAGRAILFTSGTNIRGGARIAAMDGQGAGDPLLTLTYSTTTPPTPVVGNTVILV